MYFPGLIRGVSAIFLSVLIMTAAYAQQAPQGSCLLPGGKWCWPLTPVAFGEMCTCTTADGPTRGVMQ